MPDHVIIPAFHVTFPLSAHKKRTIDLSSTALFLSDYNNQRKYFVFRMDIHKPVILFYRFADGIEADSMIFGIVFRWEEGSLGIFSRFFRIAVSDSNAKIPIFVDKGKFYQASFFPGDFFWGFQSVFQCISKDHI